MKLSLENGLYKSDNIIHIQDAKLTLEQWKKISNDLKNHANEIDEHIKVYTTFSEGEEVWICNSIFIESQYGWSETELTENKIPISIFKAQVVSIREEPESCTVQPLPMGSLHGCPKHQIFKTREEAVIEMMKHLNGLINEH